LIENTNDGSHVLIMCVVGVWRHMPPNTDQVQAITPWWRILCDPKPVGV